MKKILILNGSHSEIPLILAAKELGFYVITTGIFPDLIGHTYADEYHKADFSDINAILNLAVVLKIDAICACANDFGAITAAFVAEKMGIAGHDKYQTALTLHHKDKFRYFSIKNEIRTPYAEFFDNKKHAMESSKKYKFPLMVKPVDMTGGKGITKVQSADEIDVAVHYAFETSRVKRIVIEEFIEGTYHSLTSFIINQKVAFSFSDNEYSYLNPFLVSTSAAPANGIEDVKQSLISQIEFFASILSLVDGVFHIQYINSNDGAYIIEITRRCSGDFYPYPVNYACNINWAKWIVKAETGQDCSDFPRAEQKGFFGRHCIMASKNGIVKNVFIDNEIKGNIVDEFMMWKKGDHINNYLSQKLGVIFLRFNSKEEMYNKIEMISKLVSVEIE
jgi:biotin carboxylase